MALWRRGGSQEIALPGAAQAPAPPAAAEVPAGDLPCTVAGCAAATGVCCAYVDHRDRACPTAWCPDHREVVGGRVYCRRHAGLVRALLDDPIAAVFPDVDSRAPGLVEWLARDLGPDVEAALMATGGGDSVSSEPARAVHPARARERVWERSWRLCRHTGFVHRVGLQVREAHDTEVTLWVDRKEVARLTPPWIEARLTGERLSGEEDARRRAEFREALLAGVRRALADEASVRLP